MIATTTAAWTTCPAEQRRMVRGVPRVTVMERAVCLLPVDPRRHLLIAMPGQRPYSGGLGPAHTRAQIIADIPCAAERLQLGTGGGYKGDHYLTATLYLYFVPDPITPPVCRSCQAQVSLVPISDGRWAISIRPIDAPERIAALGRVDIGIGVPA